MAEKINRLDFNQSHRLQTKRLLQEYDHVTAMHLAVGGEFSALGLLERDCLKHLGLQQDDYLIDVGCGSGRLAIYLVEYLTGNYLGTDVVPELLNYARAQNKEPNYRFELVDGLSIPEQDNKADMVCLFSVFTHLLHEQTYLYLQEAKRVLKPGGKIIFSFLDFTVDTHWLIFEHTVQQAWADSPLNVFISKDAIKVWSEHLGLNIELIQDSGTPFFPLTAPVVFDHGGRMEAMGELGQSICVLSK